MKTRWRVRAARRAIRWLGGEVLDGRGEKAMAMAIVTAAAHDDFASARRLIGSLTSGRDEITLYIVQILVQMLLEENPDRFREDLERLALYMAEEEL